MLEIVAAALAPYGLGVDTATVDADLLDIHAHYGAKGGAFRMVEDRDARIVGHYGLAPVAPGRCELRKMYLLPGLKGQGLGRRMMEEALELAAGLGFRVMELETNSRLVEAVALYRKYGFREVEKAEYFVRCDLAMERGLGSPQS